MRISDWSSDVCSSDLLRLDDTDAGRSTAEFAAGIEADLRWLGLDWDRFARQSERLDLYAAAADRLKAAGRLYPCYETAEELELRRKVQRSEEHTSELQSLMRISSAVFFLKKKKQR